MYGPRTEPSSALVPSTNVLASKSNLLVLVDDWCDPAYRFLSRLRLSGGPHMHIADSSTYQLLSS